MVFDHNMVGWSHFFSSSLQDMKSNLTLHINCNIYGRLSLGLFVNSDVKCAGKHLHICMYRMWQPSWLMSVQSFHKIYDLIHVTNWCHFEATAFEMGKTEKQVLAERLEVFFPLFILVVEFHNCVWTTGVGRNKLLPQGPACLCAENGLNHRPL